jgi:hypothetical protein
MHATRLPLLLAACTHPNLLVCEAPLDPSDVPTSVTTDVDWAGQAADGGAVVEVRRVDADFERACAEADVVTVSGAARTAIPAVDLDVERDVALSWTLDVDGAVVERHLQWRAYAADLEVVPEGKLWAFDAIWRDDAFHGSLVELEDRRQSEQDGPGRVLEDW